MIFLALPGGFTRICKDSPAKFVWGVGGLIAVCENRVLTRSRVTVLWARSEYSILAKFVSKM